MVTGEERIGVHPMLRLVPPRSALSGLDPDRVVVGHGPGVQDGAARAVADALDSARGNTLSLYGEAAKSFLG
jgi:hypothetical protein